MSARIRIKEAKVTTYGINISSMEVIDSDTGEVLKIAKLNQKLLEFLMTCEMDVDHYFKLTCAKKKNPAFVNLINTFKLFT